MVYTLQYYNNANTFVCKMYTVVTNIRLMKSHEKK